MTEMLPFNLSFPAESVVFVVDEYSQYKKTMIDDYCYTHSPIVITDICQLFGKHAPPANKNLLLDCVLKWDDTRQYNHVAEVLRFHTTGLLMTMNKPAAFDPLIRAKVDYLVLFRGRNLRHLRRIHRQYLSGVLDDPIILSGLFKSLSWGQCLVLDLAAMQATGRFAGHYYKYSPHTDNTTNSTTSYITTSENSYANLDVALCDWIPNGITASHESDDTLAQVAIISDWEIITAIDYVISRPPQPSSTPEPTTQIPTPEPILEPTTQIPAPEPIPEPTTQIPAPEPIPEPIQKPEKLPQESTTLMQQEPITSNPEPITSNPEPITSNPEPITSNQENQQQQSWASYIYTKAWSVFG